MAHPWHWQGSCVWVGIMRASFLLALVAASSLAVITGCSSKDSSPGADSDPPIVASDKQRLTSPTIPDADATSLRDGNTAFATDFYKQLAADPDRAGKNMFFSPYSISLALATTYAGAQGDTATQMASALHFSLPQAQLHNAFDGLDLALTSRGESAKGDDGQPFRLKVTNSLWGAPQLTFQPPFLDTLALDYGAGIRLTDFTKDPESARGTINTWVDTQTEDRIKQLLGPGTITPDTRFVLVNAIYFNAAWKAPFEKTSTHDGTFHAPAGDVTASMMSHSGGLAYAKGDGYQAVSLPYDGDELSFIAVLPDSLSSFESALSADQAKSIAGSLAPKEVNLQMPKFKIAGDSISLKKQLAARGMVDAFDDAKANFTGISKSEQLSISDVIHQAFVSVDEAGTEAAAATAVVGVGGTAAPVDSVNLTIDKPFVFFVRDNATGAILFLGRVENPNE